MKKTLLKTSIVLLCFLLFIPSFKAYADETIPPRQMEFLDRGLVAVKITDGVFLSWRLMGNDDPQTVFKIYRDDTLIKTTLPTDATNYSDAAGLTTSKYSLATYVGEELIDSTEEVTVWAQQYKTIQLQRPPEGITPPNVEHNGTSSGTVTTHPDGQIYNYTPNDCSVADLDGDGEYEIIVKWDPSNSKDNSYSGITGNVYLDAYKLDGTMLWRVDLGKNIRAGAHYTQFLVYDFDGDGRAEMVCRTAPGSIDGLGDCILLGSDKCDANYRQENSNTSGSNRNGFIISGPEYLTLFDGLTGKNLHTIPFSPARGTVSSWGDNWGNRVDRFLACVAYLDGVHPSAVMCRGYYEKAAMTAYDVVKKKLVQRWAYDSSAAASISGGSIAQKGNHNLSVADVDGSGKDVIIYGSAAINHDGKRLYSLTTGHGDAIHVSKLDPSRPGLQVFQVQEGKNSNNYNHLVYDARTGEILWHSTGYNSDNGRGMAADIDPRYPGFEVWSSSESGHYDCKGNQISTSKPNSTNFRIYWDGDLQDELLDGQTNPSIRKWNYTNRNNTTLLTMSGTRTGNGSKSNPGITADILGDWREEVVVYQNSGNYDVLRIYTTTTPTTHRLYTLMHDPVYRLGVAWQNTAYNQPPHLGFYIGDGLDSIPTPNMYLVKYDPDAVEEPDNIFDKKADVETPKIYVADGKVHVFSASKEIKEIKIYSMLGSLISEVKNLNHKEFSLQLPSESKIFIVKTLTESGSYAEKVIYTK
jgi:hypothetical protein